MIFDVQCAGIWKRASAAFLDLILIAVLATGCCWGLSVSTGYDEYAQAVTEYTGKYADKYPVYFRVTSQAELDALSEEEKAAFYEQQAAFLVDTEAQTGFNEAKEANFKAVKLILINVSVSVLLAVVVLEITVPLFFGNGVTVGKKVFGLAVIRQDCVKITTFMLISRALIGKYVLELMIPVWGIIGVYFGITGISGVILPAAVILLQAGLVLATRNHSAIHDLLTVTVVADYRSQRIFADADELLEAKKKAAKEAASAKEY